MSVSFLRIGTFTAVFVAVFAVGCHPAARPKGNKIVEVDVTTPITGEVTDYEDFTGRLDALETVDIRPRVSGYVDVDLPHEKEGQFVRKGDLLFEIDPRTYKADLNLAEANLKQAEAELRLQIKNIERGRKLLASNSIGKEEYDQILANREKAAATVESMKATRDRAKLYLGFTRITAPLSGRLGRSLVDAGNLVNADQTILATIVTEDPVYAYFDVDERTYLDLATVTASSESGSWYSKQAFPVLMRLANEEAFTHIGHVDFRDNRLNANTGTIRMRGVFDNPQRHLKSGLFVRIRLPKNSPHKAWLIPDEAVQSDQGRKYVFVVQPDRDDEGKVVTDDEGKVVGHVKYRAVTLGKSIEGLREIKVDSPDDEQKKDKLKKDALTKEDLEKGARVIIRGMQRVREGAEVHAKIEAPPQSPHAPLTELLTGKGPVTP